MSIPQNDFANCDGPYPVYSPWELGNSTGAGSFDMVTGTRQSVNTYYAQLERRTGLCEPYALAKAMGVDLTSPSTERVPSFVLGVGRRQPPGDGQRLRHLRRRGQPLREPPGHRDPEQRRQGVQDYPRSCEQVMRESTADTVNDILAGVLEPGGFGQALALDKPSAGKTGTINSNMAVWFNGYTPALSTAAMIAGANSQGQPITLNGQTVGGSTIREAFGLDGRRPDVGRGDARDLRRPALRGLPAGVLRDDEEVEIDIPDVTGLTVRRAAQRLAGLGFYVSLGDPRESDVRQGRVAETEPGRDEDAHRAGPRSTSIPRPARTATRPTPPGSPAADPANRAVGVRRPPRRRRRPAPWCAG